MTTLLLADTILAKRFQIVRLISDEGDMDRVYEVCDHRDSPPSIWALKQLRPRAMEGDLTELRRLFDQEADRLKGLTHRNIARTVWRRADRRPGRHLRFGRHHVPPAHQPVSAYRRAATGCRPDPGVQPQVAPQLAEIVARAMHKEREQRFLSSAEMKQAIDALQADPAGGQWATIVPPATAPPASILCPQCRQPCRPGVRFCTSCGHALGGLARALLRVVQPFGVHWEKPLPGDRPLVIGTTARGGAPGMDLSFYDPQGHISRRHAQIQVAGSSYVVTDLGSTNGTRLNGVGLAAHVPAALRAGDRIQVGSVILEFVPD